MSDNENAATGKLILDIMNTSSIAELIAGHEVFSGLDRAIIDLLAESASERELPAGTMVFRSGEPAETFYLVCGGSITVEVPAIEGPTLELQRLGEGALLGWSWLIPPYRWNFQARVQSPTRVIEFNGRAIRERCEQDPRMGFEILKRFTRLMSERLEQARMRMIEEWQPAGFA